LASANPPASPPKTYTYTTLSGSKITTDSSTARVASGGAFVPISSVGTPVSGGGGSSNYVQKPATSAVQQETTEQFNRQFPNPVNSPSYKILTGEGKEVTVTRTATPAGAIAERNKIIMEKGLAGETLTLKQQREYDILLEKTSMRDAEAINKKAAEYGITSASDFFPKTESKINQYVSSPMYVKDEFKNNSISSDMLQQSLRERSTFSSELFDTENYIQNTNFARKLIGGGLVVEGTLNQAPENNKYLTTKQLQQKYNLPNLPTFSEQLALKISDPNTPLIEKPLYYATGMGLGVADFGKSALKGGEKLISRYFDTNRPINYPGKSLTEKEQKDILNFQSDQDVQAAIGTVVFAGALGLGGPIGLGARAYGLYSGIESTKSGIQKGMSLQGAKETGIGSFMIYGSGITKPISKTLPKAENYILRTKGTTPKTEFQIGSQKVITEEVSNLPYSEISSRGVEGALKIEGLRNEISNVASAVDIDAAIANSLKITGENRPSTSGIKPQGFQDVNVIKFSDVIKEPSKLNKFNAVKKGTPVDTSIFEVGNKVFTEQAFSQKTPIGGTKYYRLVTEVAKDTGKSNLKIFESKNQIGKQSSLPTDVSRTFEGEKIIKNVKLKDVPKNDIKNIELTYKLLGQDKSINILKDKQFPDQIAINQTRTGIYGLDISKKPSFLGTQLKGGLLYTVDTNIQNAFAKDAFIESTRNIEVTTGKSGSSFSEKPFEITKAEQIDLQLGTPIEKMTTTNKMLEGSELAINMETGMPETRRILQQKIEIFPDVQSKVTGLRETTGGFNIDTSKYFFNEAKLQAQRNAPRQKPSIFGNTKEVISKDEVSPDFSANEEVLSRKFNPKSKEYKSNEQKQYFEGSQYSGGQSNVYDIATRKVQYVPKADLPRLSPEITKIIPEITQRSSFSKSFSMPILSLGNELKINQRNDMRSTLNYDSKLYQDLRSDSKLNSKLINESRLLNDFKNDLKLNNDLKMENKLINESKFSMDLKIDMKLNQELKQDQKMEQELMPFLISNEFTKTKKIPGTFGGTTKIDMILGKSIKSKAKELLIFNPIRDIRSDFSSSKSIGRSMSDQKLSAAYSSAGPLNVQRTSFGGSNGSSRGFSMPKPEPTGRQIWGERVNRMLGHGGTNKQIADRIMPRSGKSNSLKSKI
jgi:hypothetical protein